MTAGSLPAVRVIDHGAPDVPGLRREIVDVYEAAWASTPFALTRSQVRDFAAIIDRHLGRRHFRLKAARDAAGRMAGFAYGYTSEPGGWWRDIVTDALDRKLVETWFTDCFEFVELAVRPSAQRRGVGGTLHDALLEGLPHRTSVLSTQSSNEAALRLYAGRGWTVLEEAFMFPNRHYPYTIMGLDLTTAGAPSTPRP